MLPVIVKIPLGGIVISWFVGIKLPGLEYNNQKVEAAFRKDLVLGEDEAIETVQDEIFQNVDPDEDTLIDKKSWNASDIEAKIPNIFKETQDKFIPQSLNLDLIDAVNFKKGCYTGQEIVARTHYLGKPKRRMYLGSINSPESFKIGDEITANGEKVGQIINFYEEDADFYTILFEIRIEKINLELILGKNKIINIDELN